MTTKSGERPVSEQSLLDRLVEAVGAGDAAAKAALGESWLDGVAEHDWRRWRLVEDGLFLAREAIELSQPTAERVIELFDGDDEMTDERIEALSRGAPMTASELARWKDDVVASAFSEERGFELGLGVVWAVVEIKHSKRGRCHLGVLDWTGPRERFVAAYATRVEVLNGLRSEGFLSEQDYRSRR